MTKKNKLIHTPEGVRDIYNGECRRKLAVQEKILHTLYLYGYEHIQTPSFEYADIFNEDRGSVGAQEMFKFFDRDNNMLVLRPDMTPEEFYHAAMETSTEITRMQPGGSQSCTFHVINPQALISCLQEER